MQPGQLAAALMKLLIEPKILNIFLVSLVLDLSENPKNKIFSSKHRANLFR